MDESIIRARVAGRQAADELTELYTAESIRLKDAHGLEASMAFLDQLRDNLIAIRPLPVPAIKPNEPRKVVLDDMCLAREWDDADVPDGYTLVAFDAEVKHETEAAVLIGEQWVPKSQLHGVPKVGTHIWEWPVRQWFAEKVMDVG